MNGSRSDDTAESKAALEALLQELEQRTGTGCATCERRICGHEILFNIALGWKDTPRCLLCLAKSLGRPASELRDEFADYILHRDCYAYAWDIASDREHLPRDRHPACLWSDPASVQRTEVASSHHEARAENPGAVLPDSTWDAGDKRCGDLVLALRGRLNALVPGAVLKVTTQDPAASEDLPAWCRLTGHRLVFAAHPDYYIQRKES